MDDHHWLAEKLLSLCSRLGFSYYDAYVEHDKSSFFAIEQGKVGGSAYADTSGIRIRFVKDRTMHTYSTNRLEYGEIERVLKRVKGFRGKDCSLSSAPVVKDSNRIREKRKPDMESMLNDFVRIDGALSKKKFIKFRSIYAGFGRTDTYFTSSEGSRIDASVPRIGAYVAITVGNGKETRQNSQNLQFGGIGGYELIESLDLGQRLLDDSKNLLGVMEKGVVLSASSLRSIKNVVASPDIMGIAAHESIGHPLEADRVFGREAAQAGTSYLNERNLGLEIGSPAVTIIDNPTIKNANGYFKYDDEGVKAKEKTLVENGVQKGLLTNREYAYTLKEKSNGSSRSDSYSNEPLVRMSNTYLKRGNAKFHDLVKEARNGVYIKSFAEWNIDDTRTFCRYQGNEAYLIKDGSIEKPVKNFKIETNTLAFWHAVKLTGSDFALPLGSCGKGEPTQGVPVTMGGPSALLEFGD